MKHLIQICAAVVLFGAPAFGAEAWSEGYTNSDIDGGYGCTVSGSAGPNAISGIAQFHPNGKGGVTSSTVTMNVANVGVCNFAQTGNGFYNVMSNGVGKAGAKYVLQNGSAPTCQTAIDFAYDLVCAGSDVVPGGHNGAGTCFITSTLPGFLITGICRRQDSEEQR